MNLSAIRGVRVVSEWLKLKMPRKRSHSNGEYDATSADEAQGFIRHTRRLLTTGNSESLRDRRKIMREIRFRAFSKADNKMSVSFGFDRIKCDPEEDGDDALPRICMPNGWWYPLEEVAVMKFTGLLDKGGKRIFEGDIVEMPKAFDVPVSIEFNVLGHVCAVSEKGQSSLLVGEVETCEVIGNIYQNPELLTNR